MDLNATILCEFLIFALFYGIVKIKIWPGFVQILNERQACIAAGLEAAAKGQESVEIAKGQATLIIEEARSTAKEILSDAVKKAANFKQEVEHELRELHLASQRQAVLDYDNLKKKFLLDAKNHYIDIASQLCTIVLTGSEQEKNAHSLVKQALDLLDPA